MRLFVGFLVALALSACASSSGVFQVAPDTFGITTTAITSFGGAGTARASAIRSANEHCASMGRQALVIGAEMDSQFTQGSSDVVFRCVTAEEAISTSE
jgi:hypothetical protein